jgi:hypothetical protein
MVLRASAIAQRWTTPASGRCSHTEHAPGGAARSYAILGTT